MNKVLSEQEEQFLLKTGLAEFFDKKPQVLNWQEIHLENLQNNINVIKSYVGENVDIMAIVKANAYGHGVDLCAPVLSKAGVKCFGVVSLEEALALRGFGIKDKIVLLSNLLFEDYSLALQNNIIPTVSSHESIAQLCQYRAKDQAPIKVHVKFDTGMGRFGALYKTAKEFIDFLAVQDHIEIDGVYSHFTQSEDINLFSDVQVKRFNRIINYLKTKGINPPNIHFANSGAIKNIKSAHFNMVRSGIMLYGLFPDTNLNLSLKPVMQWKTKMIFKKIIPAGHGISYGKSFTTEKETIIGIIPVGYSHGLDRGLSNKGEVLINGQRAKILGKICMDQTVIDVSDIGECKLGDEVVIIGQQDKEIITVQDHCKLTGRIPYEILCGIKNSVKKVAH